VERTDKEVIVGRLERFEQRRPQGRVAEVAVAQAVERVGEAAVRLLGLDQSRLDRLLSLDQSRLDRLLSLDQSRLDRLLSLDQSRLDRIRLDSMRPL